MGVQHSADLCRVAIGYALFSSMDFGSSFALRWLLLCLVYRTTAYASPSLVTSCRIGCSPNHAYITSNMNHRDLVSRLAVDGH